MVSKPGKVWSLLTLFTIGASAVCMLAGLSVSFLSWLSLITVSATVAYLTVGLLLGSFSLMFLAAHCMDQVAAADKADLNGSSR